ncbi:Fanconi anemia core complex-associated protein 20 [Solea senegalensis]|uniref:Fanconi anemia core complex-associated protein 20 n=1 Tax=Solea senegalensis TaxID=28829 RepID=A0AAV6SRE4_SOLSE|nr:Fanconi anemia core complex-associated protein 20 [Solea senegalensis]
MDEIYSKSKLKRKRTSTFHPETCSRDTKPKPPPPLLSGDATEERHGSAWWSREQLPAAESLWASALLHLEQQQCWDLVPHLPLPSKARPAASQVDPQWCDFREEVPLLPEPAAPSLETPPSPDPLSVTSSQQDVLLQTRPAPLIGSSDTQPSSQHTKGQDGSTAVTRPQQPSVHSWEEAAPSSSSSAAAASAAAAASSSSSSSSAAASSSSAAGPSRVRGGERKDTEPSVKGQFLTNQVKEKENKEQVVKDEEDEEEQRTVRGDEGAAAGGGGGGGERMQSCPMCLLVFPVGFTQMDCDGHLAQCLSEMNMDMTW